MAAMEGNMMDIVRRLLSVGGRWDRSKVYEDRVVPRVCLSPNKYHYMLYVNKYTRSNKSPADSDEEVALRTYTPSFRDQAN
jgi:hypothetical protein